MSIVVIEGRWIIPKPSGIGVYTRELLRLLPRMAPDLQFMVVFRSETLRSQVMAETEIQGLPNVSSVTLSYGVFSPLGQFRFPAWLRRHDCRLYHTANYMMPYLAFPSRRRGRIRCVATIHDVIPLILRDHAPRSLKSRLFPLFVACLKASVARADTVITVSEASRRDLVSALAVAEADAERIRPVHNGVGQGFRAALTHPRAHSDTDPRQLLYVGRQDPYKNLVALIETLAAVRERCPFPVTLRVVGPDDPRYPDARQAVVQLGLEDAVEFTGFVPDDALVAAYQNADLLVHPSRYEGFGLQVLEAMRSGLPVVCSDGGALPEVVGDAGVVVPVDDRAALEKAIVDLLLSPERQAECSARGQAQAEPFTWQRAAERTLAIYRELIED